MSLIIRPRGGVVQVVRQSYDKEKKRGVQTLLGSVKNYENRLPPELMEVLTDEEKATAKKWEEERQKRSDEALLRSRRRLAASTIGDVARALDAADEGVSPAEAEEIAEEVRKLKLALRRAQRKFSATSAPQAQGQEEEPASHDE